MAGTLRDDLASLRIERREASRGKLGVARDHPEERSSRGGGGRRFGGGLLAAMLWLIPLGLVGAAGLYGYRQYEKIRPKPEVSVGLVQRMTAGEKEKLLSAKGYIKSRHQAMIGAKLPGRVEKILVEEGSKVKKGQILAVLEHNDTMATLESRKATVRRTEAELAEARAELKDKDRKVKRLMKLRAANHSSVEEMEQAETSRDMAAARVDALKEAVSLMNASAKEVEETIENMHILAPFDGTVVSKESEVGETITPGGMGAASGRGSVVTLADLSTLEVEADVAENLLSRVGPGQPAEVSVSAVPGKHYRGKLRQIIPMGDRARGTIKVKVAILDPDEHLFPELVATVHFLPDQAIATPASAASGPLLFVPKAAIVEEAGHSYAWVVEDGGVVRRRAIEVVVTNDDLARVEKGLKPGESVVLDPPRTLREGEPVKVLE